jgi:hypothetical protein
MVNDIHSIEELEGMFSLPFLVHFKDLIDCLFLQFPIVHIFAVFDVLVQCEASVLLMIGLAMSLDY